MTPPMPAIGTSCPSNCIVYGAAIIDAIITVVYGNNVVNVAKNVQTAVRSVIQASTGFEDAEVNVHVSGISFDR